MVLFMVAFAFDLDQDSFSPEVKELFQELGYGAKFQVYVYPSWGFHLFLLATIASLILGHMVCAVHRYAEKIGEFDEPDDGVPQPTTRNRLCAALPKPAGWMGAVAVHGPTAMIGLSLALVIIGAGFLDTFQFRFEGLAGYILGPEASVRPYSDVTLMLAVPGSNPGGEGRFGMHFIQIAFFLFSFVVVILYLTLLLVLWAAPMTVGKQRHLLVGVQVLNAWAGLDVFCVTILAAIFEIRRLALFIVGGKCDAINQLISASPLADQITPDTCFDVVTEMKSGYWVLVLAAFISGITGQVMLARCSNALCAAHQLNAVSPA